MILRDKMMLFVYAFILIAFGTFILLLLAGFSANFITEDSWICQNFPELIEWFRNTMGNTLYRTLLVFLVGVILFLMGWNIMRSLGEKKWKGKVITIHNPMGEIRISLSAVEDFIQKCGVRLSDVRDVRSKIKSRRNEVRVFSRLSIWAGGNVPDIADRVQESIKQNMEELLGSNTKVLVFVSIERITPRGAVKEVSANGEEALPPFRSESYKM